ncbi:MAG: hypothetical protein PVH00_08905 [Gemmatimonadota bacterium]|jgi:photosystem II stability/assembly factor-like uncharacterized protein
MNRSTFPLVAILLALAGCAHAPEREGAWTLAPTLEPQRSGTSSLLIAVFPVDASVVWASGAGGTWTRTTDGGATWEAGVVPGADSIEFRDVFALDARTAWLLSIGNGPDSRIYRTDDGGANWSLQFGNEDPDAFFDCFGFWDAEHGLAFSDSHDGAFTIIRTEDGRTWAPLPTASLPPANDGEGGFASSGTCLVTMGDSTAWIGTGASGAGPRVLKTTDRGRTWTAIAAPLPAGPSAGITTVSFRDPTNGAILGGDIGRPDAFTDNVALTVDGGATWTAAAHPPFPGAVYGSAFAPGSPDPTLVAVGPGGLALTTDGARTWVPLDTLNHWGVGFAAPDAGWAVGPNGRITRIRAWTRPPR